MNTVHCQAPRTQPFAEAATLLPDGAFGDRARERAENEMNEKARPWRDWFAAIGERDDGQEWLQACADYAMASDPDLLTEALYQMRRRWDVIAEHYLAFRVGDSAFRMAVQADLCESADGDHDD